MTDASCKHGPQHEYMRRKNVGSTGKPVTDSGVEQEYGYCHDCKKHMESVGFTDGRQAYRCSGCGEIQPVFPVEQKEQIKIYITTQLNIAIEKGDDHLKTILLRVLDELNRRK